MDLLEGLLARFSVSRPSLGEACDHRRLYEKLEELRPESERLELYALRQ
ncbi:MAG: hypothetical protein M3P51_06500 [Chloroflexota bacterium]|nr:hypothetical protein [Chloroflexota bacterium]